MQMFSIVMPLYNKEYSVLKAILSIFAQKYDGWELIVINDGSTDSSYNVVKNFISTAQLLKCKVRLIHQDNQGVSAARNRGVAESKYNYICFLDADDEWYPDFLSRINNLFNLYPNESIYSLQHEVCINNTDKIRNKCMYKEGFKGYVRNFFKASLVGSIANSSKVCISKSDFYRIGGFPLHYKAGEDLFVWMELALKGKVVLDNTVCTTVNVIDDKSRAGRGVSIPYPFIYYSENNNKNNLTFWAKIYLLKIFLSHVYESIKNNDFISAEIRCTSAEVLFPVICCVLKFIIFLIKKLNWKD